MSKSYGSGEPRYDGGATGGDPTAETAWLSSTAGRSTSSSATGGASGIPGALRRGPVVRLLALVVAMVAGAAAAAVYGLVSEPSYRAVAYVAVSSQSEEQQRTVSFAQAFGRIANERAVMASAEQRLGRSNESLVPSVEIQTSPDAPLIELAGVSADPRAATDVANAVADSLVGYANPRGAETGVSLAVFSPAVEPLAPASASVGLLALVGGAGGLLIAALGLFAVSAGRSGRTQVEAASAPSAPSAQPDPLLEARRNGSAPPRSQAGKP